MAIANDEGGKAGKISEDAWGMRRNPSSWTGKPTTTDDGGADSVTPRGYTGHEMLDDLGLVHMNGRIYDPLLGRFLSADITVQFPGSLQSYNRYSYVRNNPLTSTDPSGYTEPIAPTPLTPEQQEAARLVEEKRNAADTARTLARIANEAAKHAADRAAVRSITGSTGSLQDELEERKVETDSDGGAVSSNSPSAVDDPLNSGFASSSWTKEDVLRAVYANMVYQTNNGGILNDLGIPYSPSDGFAAALYQGTDGVYILAFRGTELTFEDWRSDARQAYSINTAQYNQAVTLAKQVFKAVGGNVVFVGHSLGGGLASAASFATGAKATTFNSAGLSYTYSRGTPGYIRAHYIRGEILNTIQDCSTFPTAAGERIAHSIPNITPSSALGIPLSLLAESIARHSMDNFVNVTK